MYLKLVMEEEEEGNQVCLTQVMIVLTFSKLEAS